MNDDDEIWADENEPSESNAFAAMAEAFAIHIVSAADLRREEIMARLAGDVDHLLETIGARDEQALTENFDLRTALREYQSDTVRNGHDLLGRPSLAELVRIHQNETGRLWFWAVRWPVPADRLLFAGAAARGEVRMQSPG
jgi:hypothetical protein